MPDPRQLLNDSEETFRLSFEGQQSAIYTSMPGIIIDVNLTQNTCTVQPAIQGQIEDQNGNVQYVDMPQLIHVPIIFPKAGGFVLTLPIQAGDEVLVSIANRCIDSWWQLGGVQKAAEFRMHDLSDGFAIPGPSSVPNAISNISSTEAQLRDAAGTTYLSIAPGGIIKLVAPSGVQITGDLAVSGNITAAEVTAGTIPLKTHLHPGVATGTGDTGAPIP